MRVPLSIPSSAARSATQRLWEVDTFRGVAVILMVWYHLMWDLSFFGVFEANMLVGGWQVTGRSIGSLFIFLLGLSATLQVAREGAPRASFRSFLLRGAKIFALGLVITIATYFATPNSFVIFGILHLLGASLILLYPFLFWTRWIVLVGGLAVIGVGMIVHNVIVDHPWLLWLGLRQRGLIMSDYYPLLPWFGIALGGVFAGHSLYPGGSRTFALPDLHDQPWVRALSFLGRNSLLIYLIHQPILFAILIALGIGRL
jgi:uncharacterized membrane protein